MSRRSQEAQGSGIQAVPRKALKAGESSQIALSGRSRTFQKLRPGMVSAAWQGSARPAGLTLSDCRPQPFMHGFGKRPKWSGAT
jgi:hypothetical protein